MEIIREGFTVELEDPTLYVDNKSRRRSGHMSHALAQFAPGKFIDFNSNCSAVRWDGHSAYGWIEYRISEDAGKTYSEVYEFPYSTESFYDGIYTISVEKAVACDDGTIIAFCLRNCAYQYGCVSPLSSPMVVRSYDGGKNWTKPYEFSPHKGRIYDSLYRDGVIYALMKRSTDWGGNGPEDVHILYKSTDNGASFKEISALPFDYKNRGYGALVFDEKGDLHAYILNSEAVCDLEHTVSHDNGLNWEAVDIKHFAKGGNNPQIAFIDGIYLLHGRSRNCDGYILYTSKDAVNWDEGTYISDKAGLCYYSNHLVLKDEKGQNFLLLQYSEIYGDSNETSDTSQIARDIFSGLTVPRLGNSRVNVMHRILKIKKTN